MQLERQVDLRRRLYLLCHGGPLRLGRLCLPVTRWHRDACSSRRWDDRFQPGRDQRA